MGAISNIIPILREPEPSSENRAPAGERKFGILGAKTSKSLKKSRAARAKGDLFGPPISWFREPT